MFARNPRDPKIDIFEFLRGCWAPGRVQIIRTANFIQTQISRPQFHHSGPQHIKFHGKSKTYTMSFLTFSELFLKAKNEYTKQNKITPTEILRPNPLAENDPMMILSLSTFQEKHRFDLFFPIEIPRVHEKYLFRFKPSGIYFAWFLFSPIRPSFNCF